MQSIGVTLVGFPNEKNDSACDKSEKEFAKTKPKILELSKFKLVLKGMPQQRVF